MSNRNTNDKENATSYKKFNANGRGEGFQLEEKNKGDDTNPLQCWTCGEDHHKRDCP